jgi:hypothetical protein
MGNGIAMSGSKKNGGGGASNFFSPKMSTTPFQNRIA